MWIDERGFEHNGHTPYIQRKLDEMQANKSIEEKYQEKIEEACKWLDSRLSGNKDNFCIKFIAFDFNSKEDIINYFRKMMQLD